MEHARSARAAVAVAVASAGLFAVGPAATQTPQATVQLTAAVSDFPDIASPAAASEDLLQALARNFNLAIAQVQNGLTDLINLDLPRAVAGFTLAALNIVPSMPENILLAAVGGVTGQEFEWFRSHDDYQGGGTQALTDWPTLVPDLLGGFQASFSHASAAVESLFAGEIANSLYYSMLATEALFIAPAVIAFLGVPALVGDSLLELVGL